MILVVSYDVCTTDTEGAKRLRKVAKVCEAYGIRVQNSVFEVCVDPAQRITLLDRLNRVIDPKRDSVRIYRLGSNWEGKIESLGLPLRFEQEGVLIL